MAVGIRSIWSFAVLQNEENVVCETELTGEEIRIQAEYLILFCLLVGCLYRVRLIF